MLAMPCRKITVVTCLQKKMRQKYSTHLYCLISVSVDGCSYSLTKLMFLSLVAYYDETYVYKH